ncbi:uncharacterized protein B0H18DRAFT_966113 [Fomitopsis serialis]|uniref:uncharacterized protein n=1 Tax=Fomitopsis serialis TaxID=139415 RepID=UPI0020082EB1|nr:uncharacterized protein B0H18DRAFT_966113 [Neoantrodia serialis]KAH9938216.1 hypothetical protein B0H18DRAFT_966113 [Neoantrodia serialis]
MSLFPLPQSQGYGAAAYQPPGFAQPPMYAPPAFSYAPPAQPMFHVDPTSFRRDYSTRLAELTVNSRPIIQTLSMIAQDYTRFADIVVQCIESHIRRVPQWMKLPAFYLLDAISKNVYNPYANSFAPLVVRLFLDTYEQVDQSTRSKMEEMLLTWRTGSPNGRELFGVVPQLAIERQIWGGESTQSASSSRIGASPSVSAAQVLSELEFVLNQKERALQVNPYDKASQSHVAVLQQLRKLVQAGVSQAELSQILNQLHTLAQPAPAPAPTPIPPPPVAARPSYSAQQSSYPPPPPGVLASMSPPPYRSQSAYPPPPPPPSYGVPKSEPIDLSSFLSAVQPPPASMSSSHTAPPPPPAAAPTNNISDLFNALVKAGVVSTNGTPTGAGATAKAEELSKPFDLVKDAARHYRKTILKHKIKLTSADITKQRSHIVELMYDRLPVQCKQCGVRFPDGPAAKKTMDDHLDMHFRQNRKAGQAVSRGHSRSWFVSVEDWIHDGYIDVKGKGRADGRKISSSAAAAAEAAKREAELRALYVVVPPGDEAKPISCPICKEPLKSEFLEDDEEWVWRNAVRRDDKIYHATCHAEAMASKSTLAVRLRNEMAGSRSRSITPEKLRTPPKVVVDGVSRKSESPSPTSPVGMKRKAEDDDALAGRGDAPPAKKFAVAA